MALIPALFPMTGAHNGVRRRTNDCYDIVVC